MRPLLKTSALMFLVISTSCSWISRKTITTQYYRDHGELVVLTRNSATTYYEDNLGQTVGFEYDLINEFARDMNVKARFIVVDSIEQLVEELEKGHAHLAAAGLTATKSREKDFIFGPSYMSVEEQVVCHRDIKVRSAKDLIDKKILVIESTSYVENLKQLKEKHPDLTWLATDEKSTEQILNMVWQKQVDCTIADSVVVDLNRRYFPDLKVAFTLTANAPIAWMMLKEQKKLRRDLRDWHKKIKKGQRLKNIKDRYFSPVPKHDFYDLNVFARRVDQRLPNYATLFKKASKKINVDWRLLAALSYQESHWNPAARSPTGVRGLMMLTSTTAKEVGVENRLDPQQSIFGGSRYFRKILDRVPSFIPREERLWFALAAYNVGWSHLADARKLAIDLNKNPNNWKEVRSILPFLSQPRYYTQLRHGYARGYEPVIYVARIRRYYDYLKKNLK